MSGDPEQEYFSDGLAEDIITALSHWRSFPVVARNSTFSFKGQKVRVGEIAQELGARYILEGSVRKAGKRLRITAQLIDAQTPPSPAGYRQTGGPSPLTIWEPPVSGAN